MNIDNSGSFGCAGALMALIFSGFLVFFLGTSQDFSSAAPHAPSAGVVVTIEAPPADAQSGSEATFQSLTTVERVDVVAANSHFEVTAAGYQPDGCDFPVNVEQSRDGNKITIKIYREMPISIICAQNLVLYRDTIRVEGPFEAGTYTIDVNGTVVEVTL
ncbi:MAG: hypothetical protein R3E39_29495 [Anaerolineae bacterium]